MATLWESDSADRWTKALETYEAVVAAQGVARLVPLDDWYRLELPAVIASRSPRHVLLDELARLTEWKMARGVWRPRNLGLVRSNDAKVVIEASTEALNEVPHPRKPIARLAALGGVGPATASAVASAAEPGTYPFFDEIVAAQVPGLGPVAFTLPFYVRYAEALRERAGRLGGGWTPTACERALWAEAGGKAGKSAS